MDLSTFIFKWKDSGASERANKDSFLRDLCDVLGAPRPDAKTGDPDRDQYVFEREAVLVHGGERHSVGFIDLYKRGCFILEAKQGSDADSKKIGTARRGTPAWQTARVPDAVAGHKHTGSEWLLYSRRRATWISGLH